MSPDNEQMDALRIILENILQPQRLDKHPWTESLIVQQAGIDMPDLLKKSPGQRLIIAILRSFRQMMPATPPRQGKRLDTRWGEFGILAAQYFAPLVFGEARPATLREAWANLDKSILLFVYGKSSDALTNSDRERYRLAGGEIVEAPNSTLSDWHRNGMEGLFNIILGRENFLSGSLSKPAVIRLTGQAGEEPPPVLDRSYLKRGKSKSRMRGQQRFLFLFPAFLFLGFLLYGGFEAWRIYQQAMLVREDITRITDIVRSDTPIFDRYQAVGSELAILERDFLVLKDETEPFLWLGPLLGWMPVHGGDLASIQDLMIIADTLLSSANISYNAISPYLDEMKSSGIEPTRLTEYLSQIQPQLIETRQYVEEATSARSRLDPGNLSPEVRDLILYVDRLLPLMQDGLTIAEEFPSIMGAMEEGPKTYLLLVQNEDELRPTGGFITGTGILLIQDGRISNLTFADSGNLDNWSKPYPAAPWQLSQYMNSSVLILRDTNWFTNYPTAALYAETLYSYVNVHSVDGVIAFDQQMLVQILEATGPIQLEGVSDLIDSSNVIAYMRSVKTPTWEERNLNTYDETVFIKQIADALIKKIYSGDIPPERLIQVVFQVLNEHHVLVQMDNSSITSLLGRHRWDGAVRPEDGDFLMVVDSNIGFNKTNAVVESSLSYYVDLSIPDTPTGSLTVFHKNNSAELICKQWDKIRDPDEKFYPITDCYWNYLRVYLPAGAELLESQTQSVPGYWMIIKQDIPAHVDVLDEGIDGIQAFGTLQVIPGQESSMASFRFALPAKVLETQPGTDQTIYRLLIQKQPGTVAVPITLRVLLPENATIQTIPVGAVNEGDSILFQTDLRTDVRFEIVLRIP